MRPLLQDFQNVFPEKLPTGLPPQRSVAHDAVRDAVASIATVAGFRVGREQRHLLPRAGPDGAHRFVDLLFTDDA